ncbi:myb/SANT-like domain, Harbinger transposase-derived nuclease domain protein [Artemisia annua]|uniref:Myb/SANT-like domain, Harbinger transposase-derived nuclease domain protein n=1 Tax=Artemisia annua TaxID=35608 RepID=A0A2U1Q123_ARTAN|nr:myb/SANT-like domain, Harbinger transposase-derived nuclease domain protein [Artemisia annua]
MTCINQGSTSANQGATSANQGATSANKAMTSANQGRRYANRNYHGWTSSEDEKLIEALLHMPHIESRIRTMKSEWQVVYDMLHSNGFGYDEENNYATKDALGVWDCHLRAAKLRDQKLANYPELSLIFGKS